MAKGASYRVQLRRRRQGKTDYQARKGMVISGRPRLVTRPSIRNMNAQIIVAKQKGDQTLFSVNSHEIVKKYGWKAPTGNIPAAYLTGLLCGLKAKTAGVNEAILDLGLINPTKGARVFAVLHGVIDAGVEIPHGEEKIVKDRSKGDHIARYAKALSGEQDVYRAKFSKYTANGVLPEKLAEHFSQVRATIVGSFKGIKVAPEPESAPEPKVKAVTKPASKPEVKPVSAPKVEPKTQEIKSKEATVQQIEATSKPKIESKVESKPAIKVEETISKTEVKVETKPEVKAAKKIVPETEETPKTKAVKTKAKVVPKKKVTKENIASAKKETKTKAKKTEKAPKEKSPAKEKAPKAKATLKKATKKGENKE